MSPISRDNTGNQVARIEQSLDRAQSNIDRLGPNANERKIESIERSLERDEARLEGLDPTNPDVIALKSRFQSVRDALADASAAADEAADARAAQMALLEERQGSGRIGDEEAFIRSAQNLADQVKFMDHEHGHLQRADGIAEQYSRFAASYPGALAQIDEILSDYEGMDPRDVRQFGGPALAMLIQDGGPEFKLADEKLAAFGELAVERATSLLDEAEREARALLDAGRAGELIDNPIVSAGLNYLDNVAMIYGARPDADAGTIGAYDQLKARAEQNVRGLLLEAFADVVANNAPVSNTFTGADRALVEQKVRERWANAYPNDEILQIRISQDEWVRRREPGWRDGVLVMFEYSIITPWVVVSEPDGMASQWGMVAEKDHLQNDEITISFGRTRTDDLDPQFTVLQSNLD